MVPLSLTQEIRRLTFLFGLTERLQTVSSVEAIGRYALRYLVENMGAAFGDIKLISGEGQHRRASMLVNGLSSQFVATHGEAIAGMEDCLNAGIPYGQGLLWEVVKTGEPLFVEDYANHPQAVEDFRHPNIGQLGIFPIKDQAGAILAVLTLESRTEAPLEEAPQQDILVAACQILGAAVERAQA
ncbi:MAG: GAF domain-containing protein, partial [Limnothrix sp.]